MIPVVEVKDCCRLGGVIDMPGIEKIAMGYDGGIAAAVPYSWETAPGKPIAEAGSAASEARMAPLAPPPGSKGARRPVNFSESAFHGFAPEVELQQKSSGQHFAEKLFKKLQGKLKKKSKVLAASLSVENLRSLTEHKKRTSSPEGSMQSRSSYDSDERGEGSWSSCSTFEHPDTPNTATSTSSMNSLSSSLSWDSNGSYPNVPSQAGSQQLGSLPLSDDDVSHESDDESCRAGPRESAWHEDSEEEEELTEQEWQIVRYVSMERGNSSLFSTFVRQSSLTPLGDHSYQLSPLAGRKSEHQ